MCDDIFRIDIFADFELDCAHIKVTAQGPEVRFLDGINAGQASDLLIAARQLVIEAGRLSLHKNADRLLDQRQHAERDQNRDEH